MDLIMDVMKTILIIVLSICVFFTLVQEIKVFPDCCKRLRLAIKHLKEVINCKSYDINNIILKQNVEKRELEESINSNEFDKYYKLLLICLCLNLIYLIIERW